MSMWRIVSVSFTTVSPSLLWRFSGHDTFRTTANLRCNSKLFIYFIALSLRAHDAMVSQPIALQLCGRLCVWIPENLPRRRSFFWL